MNSPAVCLRSIDQTPVYVMVVQTGAIKVFRITRMEILVELVMVDIPRGIVIKPITQQLVQIIQAKLTLEVGHQSELTHGHRVKGPVTRQRVGVIDGLKTVESVKR